LAAASLRLGRLHHERSYRYQQVVAMDVRHLNHFLAIVEQRSAGSAAEHLHMSQPALSKSIRHLEDSLGVKLFERGPSGMTPTVYGKLLAERARSITVELRNTLLEIESLKDSQRGSTVVGASPSMMTGVLARAIARLTAQRPQIFVRVVEGIGDSLMPGLLNGTLDFIIGTWVPADGQHRIRSEILLQDEVSVIAGANHPLGRQRSVDLKDAIGFPWVLASESDSLRYHLDEVCRARNVAPPRPQIMSGSAQFIKSMLREGNNLGYLPRLTTKMEEDAGIIIPIRVAALTWVRNVRITTRARGTIPPAGRALMAELREIGREAKVFGSRPRSAGL
jgi:DNA-binding transcriptional LysR family regulator